MQNFQKKPANLQILASAGIFSAKKRLNESIIVNGRIYNNFDTAPVNPVEKPQIFLLTMPS